METASESGSICSGHLGRVSVFGCDFGLEMKTEDSPALS